MSDPLRAAGRVLDARHPSPRTRVERDPGGAWESVFAVPAPAARDAVLGAYHGWTERQALPNRRREVPFAGVPLILNLGPAFTIESADRARADLGSFVAGLYDEHVIVASTGVALCLQINLTPLGAAAVLGVPMHALANRTVALDDVLGVPGGRLVQRLGDADTWPARFALLDAFFADRLARARPMPPRVTWAVGRLAASSGQVPVAELLAATGVSPKRLVAEFREYVGLPPKVVARVLRFERAVALVRRGGRHVRWTDLALECGYYDQAHLIREFRALAGCTPTDLRDSVLPGGGLDGS